MIKNKEKNFISLVLYINNDEECILNFLNRISKFMDSTFEKFEIICVNDASNDASIKQIKEFSSNTNFTISVINMSYYQGLELAMNAGVDASIGDFVYEFDSISIDYSLDILLEVYKHSLEGYDIVSAAPKKNKNIVTKLFYCCFNKLAKYPYKLRTESFRILSRRAINRVYSISKTVPYRKALYANAGLKISTYVYENFNYKQQNKKHNHKISKNELAINALVLFTDAAYRIAMLLTLIMMSTTIVIGGYVLITFLGTTKPIEGWTTIMLFLSFSFFGIFAIFTIIIKYLSIIVDLIFKKQRYLIESISKLN